ncbi:hypothetical protein SERLA73DRAFT_188173 [Serpula lacrymans var. lacrymans S7.3]|uniref:Uncharacterized protein n=2 Tax=Serpula lacrymans var. lacrymans TaxID=341189 RepID=F8QAV5_SERL3|nr:uncharacterized protein SERLADRAFT_478197 [Serpula lacrymans var. lacrymans S7.9]EGN94341.1 hypothetical protein SERLA73DRAFT_188173 [Serpula lacrymans var. lacrymans S7.3]EGO19828.1 hypothetical protein SERLADRAFT_478197 [Serpula lacrymans var. lacrymans S7.9]
MRSFSSLSVLFTVALGAFTSAAPASSPVAVLAGKAAGLPALPAVGEVTQHLPAAARGLPQVPDVSKEVNKVKETAHLARDSTPRSIAMIMTGSFSEIAPYCQQLQYVNAKNATVVAITPAVTKIRTSLTAAVTEIQLLKGQPLSIILRAVDGVTILTVAGLAQIIAIDLAIIFRALGAVLAVVTIDAHAAVFALLVTVGAVVGTLLQVVVGLVAGLAVAVLGLLDATVKSIIVELSLKLVISVLGITV